MPPLRPLCGCGGGRRGRRLAVRRSPMTRTRAALYPHPHPKPVASEPRGRRLAASIARAEPLESRTLLASNLPAGFADTSNWISGNPTSATSMAFAPDGRLFVTLQTGQLRVIKNGQRLTTPFVDIGASVIDDDGERGLLGVTFDPDFLNNGHVYVYYTVQAAGGDGIAGAFNRVARFTAVDADPDPARYAPGDTAPRNSEVILMNLDTLSG